MLYMGNFVYLTNQQEPEEVNRRYGEFSLIIQADNSESAIDLFRDRIINAREHSDLLGGECRVFFTQLLEFDTFPDQQPLMLNYKSTAGDPAMPFIGCTVPGADLQVCRIFDWKNNQPEVDGENEQLFLEFKAYRRKRSPGDD